MNIESVITIITVGLVPAVAYIASIGIFTRSNTDSIRRLDEKINRIETQMSVDHDLLIRLDEKLSQQICSRPTSPVNALEAV